MRLLINQNLKKELLRFLYQDKTKDNTKKAELIQLAKKEGFRSIRILFTKRHDRYFLVPIELSTEKGTDYYLAQRSLKKIDIDLDH